MAQISKTDDNRLDGVLAIAIVALIALVLVSFVVFAFGTAGGWLADGSPATIVLLYIPYFGLPIAVILMIVLVVRVARRRARESRER